MDRESGETIPTYIVSSKLVIKQKTVLFPRLFQKLKLNSCWVKFVGMFNIYFMMIYSMIILQFELVMPI